VLEGKSRPGHFQGVCQVVKRLLDIVNPTHLFLGQKDYQQCLVLKRLLQLQNSTIRPVICPTLREQNGLAMSSRNLRLTTEQKDQAAAIYRTLMTIQQEAGRRSPGEIKEEAGKNLLKNNCQPDYVEIARADDLTTVSEWKGNEKLVALIAACINGVRLIDNMLLDN
jgi:pantoate--beta-alanine ligase